MILLTRVNGTPILLNDEFIELVEETPDTVITMKNGHRYLVKESINEIIERAVSYNRRIMGR
ncbi:MAG: flagellar FlbD family protein [Oscillospiraceae bacterium]|nr:flagellar FlbD family protein [Oscillospiraceae bacterium]MBQ4312469.1 flagellar FlbD family protein [Oscillospiraceae bacterium]MBQ5418111.1 flagellar FlbD family protein [Oscillospiraceae bacterium]